MKIGIFTFHRAINYGAVLQACSLKRFLEKSGHQVEFVDYWPDYHNDLQKRFVIDSSTLSRRIRSFGYSFLTCMRSQKRRKAFQSFLQRELGLVSSVKYRDSKKLYSLNYDALIYGSDQIWWHSQLPDFKGYDRVYWGQYVPLSIPKITYAASMGKVNFQMNDLEQLKHDLKAFSSLSVREKALQLALKDTLKVDSQCVLDPVFLNSKESWIELAEKGKRPIKEAYLFYYNLLPNKATDEKVAFLAKKHHLKVVRITGRVRPFTYQSMYHDSVSPYDFLAYIQYASMVVSSSFHGVALSLIMEKEFIATGFGDKTTRVISLLSQLNLENRLVNEKSQIDDFQSINYVKVTQKLKDLSQNSKAFLTENL
ncbi:polysaccharide pyruvyl transferase family protein [Gammaproteobacteria bacterium]|nr:polysaccharide pyruvyl transferase family protein [Gammaproteobacteria bacterium]